MTSPLRPLQSDVDFLRTLPLWIKVLIAVIITLALAAAIYLAVDMVHWYQHPSSPD
jgi:hypothetical protein